MAIYNFDLQPLERERAEMDKLGYDVGVVIPPIALRGGPVPFVYTHRACGVHVNKRYVENHNSCCPALSTD